MANKISIDGPIKIEVKEEKTFRGFAEGRSK